MYKCKFCLKEFEKCQSLGSHTMWCDKNPNSKEIQKKFYENVKKSNSDKNIVEKRLATYNKNFLNGKYKNSYKPLKKEDEIKRREKISKTMKLNPNAGGLREGSGRGKKCWYESNIAGKVYIRSTYELEYVKWLDFNNINWRANKEKFPYIWEEKIRNYYPDFYLIDENCYIEIKGFETEKDKAKWKSFPYKLKILKYQDLKKLGLIINGK